MRQWNKYFLTHSGSYQINGRLANIWREVSFPYKTWFFMYMTQNSQHQATKSLLNILSMQKRHRLGDLFQINVERAIGGSKPRSATRIDSVRLVATRRDLPQLDATYRNPTRLTTTQSDLPQLEATCRNLTRLTSTWRNLPQLNVTYCNSTRLNVTRRDLSQLNATYRNSTRLFTTQRLFVSIWFTWKRLVKTDSKAINLSRSRTSRERW